MRNKKRILFEVIQREVIGESEAVDTVSNICLCIRGKSMTTHRTD